MNDFYIFVFNNSFMLFFLFFNKKEIILIKKIIIKNFKSIINLELSFNKNLSNLHSFIGINESGKSNILKAINCISNGFKKEDINVSCKTHDDAYILFFVSLIDKDFARIKELGYEGNNELIILSSHKFNKNIILKEIEEFEKYNLSNRRNINYFLYTMKNKYKSFIDEIYKYNSFFINEINDNKDVIQSLNIEVIDDIFKIFENYDYLYEIDIFNFFNNLQNIDLNLDINLESQKIFLEKKINTYIKKLSNILNNKYNDFSIDNVNSIDNIVSELKFNSSYISTYKNDLKNKYLWSEIKEDNNLVLKSFIKNSNITIDELKDFFENGNIKSRNKIVKKFNSKFKCDLDFFGITNDVEITCEIDTSQGLIFFVKDKYNDELLEIDHRSDGFKQFLALLIIFYKNNYIGHYCILLLDEPGYSLHPKAQKSLINKMFDWSENIQIFYTTHFPYMIHDDLVYDTKVVHRNKNGTKIIKSIFNVDENIKNEEPILPLLIYLGLDIENNLTFPKAKKVCLVEGISDFFYLKLIMNIVNDSEINNENIMIIPKFGSNMPSIISFLNAFEKEYIYLIDSDKNPQVKKEIAKLDLCNRILDYEFIFGKKMVIEDIIFSNNKNNESCKIEKSYNLYTFLKKINFKIENETYENVDLKALKTNGEKIINEIKNKFNNKTKKNN